MSHGLENDIRWMEAALALGRRGLGFTAPNPSVAALIVRDGVVVGRGVTQPGGRPHAEVVALNEAGAAARGATVYVTLEPCSHHGQTPPCAESLVSAGVARVVSAVEDPNPLVAGRGHAMLRTAGVEVVTGICEAAARFDHLGHILRIAKGRPKVTLKLARTADGYAAGDEHDSRLAITGEIANHNVQSLRSMNDAIMVGVGTVLGDDPLLTVRIPGFSQKPLRVVIDSRLRLPETSRLAASARELPTLALTTMAAPAAREDSLRARGVQTQRVGADEDGRVNLPAALAFLAAKGVTRVFSEGGPRVGSALIDMDLADEVILFTATKPLGRDGRPALSAAAMERLTDSSRYSQAVSVDFGADRMDRWLRRQD